MDYAEFLELCKKAIKGDEQNEGLMGYHNLFDKMSRMREWYKHFFGWRFNEFYWHSDDDIIRILVNTGGWGGGSCFGDEPQRYEVDEEDRTDHQIVLDTILEKVAPNISFLQYRKLKATDAFYNFDYGDTEYYGNSTDYTIYMINMNRLYKHLQPLMNKDV